MYYLLSKQTQLATNSNVLNLALGERMFRLILTALICITLTSCDWEPDLREQIPKIFPIKKLAHSKAKFMTCVVNIFELETSFKTKFNEALLNEDNDVIWFKTPPQNKIQETSQAWLAIGAAPKCLDKTPKYLEMFLSNLNEDDAYFTSRGNDILIYSPTENILFYTAWD